MYVKVEEGREVEGGAGGDGRRGRGVEVETDRWRWEGGGGVCEGMWKVEEWREVKARGVGGQDWWE